MIWSTPSAVKIGRDFEKNIISGYSVHRTTSSVKFKERNKISTSSAQCRKAGKLNQNTD